MLQLFVINSKQNNKYMFYMFVVRFILCGKIITTEFFSFLSHKFKM